MSTTATPLRYPGGKSALTDFLARVARVGGFRDGYYAEPYCGGAGAAIGLLLREVVSDIFLNDIDHSIYSFWQSVLLHADELCERVERTELTVDEWRHQRERWQNSSTHSVVDAGFACLFLNRVNRSGVLRAGLIGGKAQAGPWKMDARFNRKDLIEKIKKIARYRNRIHVSMLDAEAFLETTVAKLSHPALVYLDPPYFVKGQCLYKNHYQPEDHQRLAAYLRGGALSHWLVSYDAAPEIDELYGGLRRLSYSLSYSASQRYAGNEIAFFSPDLKLPEEIDPFLGSGREWNGCFTS